MDENERSLVAAALAIPTIITPILSDYDKKLPLCDFNNTEIRMPLDDTPPKFVEYPPIEGPIPQATGEGPRGFSPDW